MSDVLTTAKGELSSVDPSAFRNAMRQLAGGISVITVGTRSHRSGLTATSVSSLSADPPLVIFCMSRASSSWQLLEQSRAFAINVLAPKHHRIAERFSGRSGEKGHERYVGATWSELVTGAPILADAVASLDCVVDELIERHNSAIVVGRVQGVRMRPESDALKPLVYWRGAYITPSHK